MVQMIDKPGIARRQIGENASFLLLRHSASSGWMGLDVGSAGKCGDAEQNMKAFELLGFADYAGLSYWDAGQLDVTNASLAVIGVWAHLNKEPRIIATRLYISGKSSSRNNGASVFDDIRSQCDALRCQQLDLVYLVAEHYDEIQRVSGQLSQAVQCGMVKSYGHSAYTIEQARQLVRETAVTLLHLQLNDVKLQDLLELISLANSARVGVVMVLTDALIQCIYQYGLKNQIQCPDDQRRERSPLGYVPALRHLLDDNPCLLKVVPPKAGIHALKHIMSHLK